MCIVREPTLSIERLRELVCLADGGLVLWLNPTNPIRTKPGSVAGRSAPNRGGYRDISIDRRKYPVHRVVWALSFGEWPKQTVDHINGDKLDNRIENLRLATPEQQQQNRPRKRGHTLPKGVTTHRKTGKYQAMIGAGKRRIYLGLFVTPEAAGDAYAKAAAELHGEFACLSR